MPIIFVTQSWYVAITVPENQRLLALGILSALRGIAFLGYALFGGTFADRFPRTKVIYISHFAGLISVLIIGGLLLIPMINNGEGLWLPIMMILFATFGIINAQDMPTRTAMIRDTVPEQLLPQAITLHQLAMSIGLLIAAPLAGFSIDYFGFATTYMVAGITHIAVLIAVRKMSVISAADPEASNDSIMKNLQQGLISLRSNPIVRWTIFSNWIVTSLGLSVMGGLIAAWINDVLLLEASDWGIMIIFWGVGGVCASLWLSWKNNFQHLGLWYLGACTLMGLSILGFSVTRVVLLAFVLNGIVGFSYQLILTLSVDIIQRQVPNRLMGRTVGILMLASGIMQIVGILAGFLAQNLGIETIYIAAGVTTILFSVGLILFQRPLRNVT
tara:strand:- start:1474 stop:2634 length:1161 start_codon:yes stop_codon:yes gene_type:complete